MKRFEFTHWGGKPCCCSCEEFASDRPKGREEVEEPLAGTRVPE